MSSKTVDVIRSSARKFALKGAASTEFDPVAALGPEAPRPIQIAALQEIIGLKVREIAYASGVSEQTIRNWKRSDSHDRPSGYDDLRAVAERVLRAHPVNSKVIGAWFRSRNRGLGYTRPLEAIRAGEFAKVMDVAESFIALSPPVAAQSPRRRRQQRSDFQAGRDIGKELAEYTESSRD
jgi:DNA-binding transcriptional regulator YiaG